MTEAPQPLQPFKATVRDYTGLIDALRARKAALGLTNAAIDELSGMQPGYTGKLLGDYQGKTLGPMSFDVLLATLAVQLVMVDDVKAARKMEARWERRERPDSARTPGKRASNRVALTRAAQREALRLALQKIGKKGARRGGKARAKKLAACTIRRIARQGNRARNAKMTPEQRSQSARKAALARWAKEEDIDGCDRSGTTIRSSAHGGRARA